MTGPDPAAASPAVADETPVAEGDGVRLERRGPLALVTLCRPDVLNAQTPQMWHTLRRISRELPGDVRVVVVRGEGRAFSAGLDRSVMGHLGGLARMPEAAADAEIAGYQEAFSWLRRPDLVTVAAVRGHAVGAGFQLALACDFRVCAEDTQFSMAEIKLGLVPDLCGTKRLVELVGYSRALEICLTGRRVAAAEAERIGLANLVVPGGDLDATVDDLVAAVLSADRSAVIEIKALLAGASARTFAEQEAAERAAQGRRIRSLTGIGD